MITIDPAKFKETGWQTAMLGVLGLAITGALLFAEAMGVEFISVEPLFEELMTLFGIQTGGGLLYRDRQKRKATPAEPEAKASPVLTQGGEPNPVHVDDGYGGER